MADKRVDELTRETLETLDDNKRFVMFDTSEGKSASLGDVKDFILGDVDNEVEEHTETIRNMNLRMGTFCDELEVDEEGLVWLLNDGERIAGPYGPFAGGGGGGGGGGNNAILTVMNTSGWLTKTISDGASCPISLNWSSTEDDIPTGDGILTVKVNGSTRLNKGISQGNVTFDVGSYLSSGQNLVRVTVSDVYSNTKSINYTVSMITLTIKSSFDSATTKTGAFDFPYTPTGNVEKTVYFVVDGTTIGTEVTTASGRQQTYSIPAQTHGSHTLLVYFEAEVNGETVRSNELYYDIICTEDGVTTPIIASAFRATTAEQYTTLVIPYTVYDPSALSTEVTLQANGETVSTQTVDRTQQTWLYRADATGTLSLAIKAGTVTKSFTVTVTESTIDAKITTESMVLSLQSAGRSNNEANPDTWVYNDISCTFTGFNHKSDGWLSEGDSTVLRVAGDARLTIPYKPFAQDFRTGGKTIEIDFATRDVLNYDAVILSCMNGGRGIQLTAQGASLTSEQSSISAQYKENEHIRLSFVVEKRSENRLIYVYLNGIISGVAQYPADDDFSQTEPVNISIGSNYCAMDIYSIRIYDNDLTRNQMLDNFIADTQSIDTMLERYNRNNVYDEYDNIVIAKLPTDLPYMIITCPQLPQYKGDKKTVSVEYVDPTSTARSFTAENVQADVQGTSSQYYARKNYKMKFKSGFKLGTGDTVAKYQIRSDAIATNTFTMKADVASSEGANNVELARLYNSVCPYKTPAQTQNNAVRQGIDGFPIVIFWNDGNTTQFVGKYNFNNDKGTEEVFGFVNGDESWEIKNNTSDRVIWKSDDYSGSDWLNDFEARYPDTDPAYENPAQLAEFATWVKSTDRTQATGDVLAEAVTYDGVEYTADTADYRLAKFKAEAGNYMELQSAMFYYMFTELFLMVDSRAKNAFPSFIGGAYE